VRLNAGLRAAFLGGGGERQSRNEEGGGRKTHNSSLIRLERADRPKVRWPSLKEERAKGEKTLGKT